jgi:hypothetical protein
VWFVACDTGGSEAATSPATAPRGFLFGRHPPSQIPSMASPVTRRLSANPNRLSPAFARGSFVESCDVHARLRWYDVWLIRLGASRHSWRGRCARPRTRGRGALPPKTQAASRSEQNRHNRDNLAQASVRVRAVQRGRSSQSRVPAFPQSAPPLSEAGTISFGRYRHFLAVRDTTATNQCKPWKMDAVQDAWSVSLQCPHCQRTGTATIHEGPRFRVEVLTAGFGVIERPNSPDIRCATCNSSALRS